MNLKKRKQKAWQSFGFLTLLSIILMSTVSSAENWPKWVGHFDLEMEKQSLKIIPATPKKIKIIGRVLKVSWEGHDSSFNYAVVDPNSPYKKIKTAYEGKRGGSYMPSKIISDILHNDEKCSNSSTIDVLSDGQFSDYLEIPDNKGYYFSIDPNAIVKSGYGWYKTTASIDFRLGSVPWHKDGYRPNIYGDGHKIPLYYLDIDKESLPKVDGFVTKVKINFAEKNSRVPIEPTVKITMEDGPSINSIKAKWEMEYDSKVVEILEKKLSAKIPRNTMKKGEVKIVKYSDSIEFPALVGSSFKIETIDRDFYYFKGIIRVNKAPIMNKTVLLIEIGNKVRPDDEGHGGQIISN